MRWFVPGLVVLLAGCASQEPVPCAPAAVSRAPLSIGVAHVAGAYQVRSGAFLQAGADEVKALGAKTLKVWLTPEYRTKYPQPGWPDVRSLSELASTPQLRALFDEPFDTFVLTTSSFALGVGDPWRASDDDALYAAEQEELRALTATLLERYAGTGKTFVLQTWEGDWVLRAGLPSGAPVPADRAARMRRWLDARQAGVTLARQALPVAGVQVINAVEVNLVLGEHSTVLTEVLPGACVEAVSYSAWEALAVDTARPLDTQAARVSQQLEEAVRRIREAVGSSVDVMLGEVGFAENEHPRGQSAALLQETLDTARRLALSRAIYWQVYDNECTSAGCRGLWLVRADGTASEVAPVLSAVPETVR